MPQPDQLAQHFPVLTELLLEFPPPLIRMVLSELLTALRLEKAMTQAAAVTAARAGHTN